MKPQVTKVGLFDMQVCVPSDWVDELVEGFANSMNPSGTDLGWKIRKEGSKWLAGDPERVSCSDREGFVHIMLEC